MSNRKSLAMRRRLTFYTRVNLTSMLVLLKRVWAVNLSSWKGVTSLKNMICHRALEAYPTFLIVLIAATTKGKGRTTPLSQQLKGEVSFFLWLFFSTNITLVYVFNPLSCQTGNVLRIRLPLRKHNETNASAIEEPQSCPAKGSETRVQERTEEHISHAKTETKAVEHGQLNVEPFLELPLSTSERRESKSSKKATLSYKTLIEDWVPELPSCHWLGQNESDDEDWLFGYKSRQHGV